MTFRTRLTLVAAAAVAVAVAIASVGVYVAVRQTLRGQVDDALRGRFALIRGLELSDGFDEMPLIDRLMLRMPDSPFGGPGAFVQIIGAGGAPAIPRGEEYGLPVSARARDVAAGSSDAFFDDVEVADTHVRVLTAPLRAGFAVQLARPLEEVDRTMRRLAFILGGFTVAGIAWAALLGGLVARAALAPVRRLSDATAHVTTTRDLSRRIESGGRDELSRLAESFNTMLEALQRSLGAQRQLVADASHELRTPLTSLRTNIEVLARSGDLAPEERERLLADVVSQLEELTLLVSDVVELARDGEPRASLEDVRLDLVVEEAVERARRHAPGVSFETDVEPTVVRGAGPRIARAVANLLDNAAKWSPPGAAVEVSARAGEVAVRDRGPGIADEDLPHVFERFYRARDARGQPGSGLGLAIVRQVAEAHGGRVTVEQPPDGGTRFRLELPNGS